MTNPPGAMPPLPEPSFQIAGLGFDVYMDEEMESYAQAYAAPLIARVAELEAVLEQFQRLDFAARVSTGVGFPEEAVRLIDAAIPAKD